MREIVRLSAESGSARDARMETHARSIEYLVALTSGGTGS